MDAPLKLHMVLLGGKPAGRLTEQHDIFFGIGKTINDLVPQMKKFWPDVNLHIDVWREVTCVGEFRIEVVPRAENTQPEKLFFLNLGGYKPGEFEEYHYKELVVARSMADAIKQAKGTAFYKEFGFDGAVSHIDNKYGIDVDDAFEVTDIFDLFTKAQYALKITTGETAPDALHIGYLPLKSL
ncbi:DUF1543 domain-containing protein [Flavobacterium longum]|uniref:DUF1543 domain-containing protein n=1 Tax=Flavobacterium longum TaxID=1299340 RepID=UPI0039EBADC5